MGQTYILSVILLGYVNRKSQGYAYGKREHKDTLQKINHYLRCENAEMSKLLPYKEIYVKV